MVDVGAKAITTREASAEGRIAMSHEALTAVWNGETPKGDALATARIAGIQAAKKTWDLIPLCHPLMLTSAKIEFARDNDCIIVRATVRVDAKTGVEMEALAAVSTALLTLYDMAKALDKTMRLDGIHVTSKSGGSTHPHAGKRTET